LSNWQSEKFSNKKVFIDMKKEISQEATYFLNMVVNQPSIMDLAKCETYLNRIKVLMGIK
jgi:hypothetical protein